LSSSLPHPGRRGITCLLDSISSAHQAELGTVLMGSQYSLYISWACHYITL
jgi:hypothetical protein